jgi:hypothetical protein
MSTPHEDGLHYVDQFGELWDGAAHAHRIGEQQGKQDHPTGHDRSRYALKHSSSACDTSNPDQLEQLKERH